MPPECSGSAAAEASPGSRDRGEKPSPRARARLRLMGSLPWHGRIDTRATITAGAAGLQGHAHLDLAGARRAGRVCGFEEEVVDTAIPVVHAVGSDPRLRRPKALRRHGKGGSRSEPPPSTVSSTWWVGSS